MDEYIKKETAYRAIMGERPEAREPSWFAELVLDIPAVDAVEVVRCRDCKYFAIGGADRPWCRHEKGLCDDVESDYFCSYGERRRDGQTEDDRAV